MAKEQPSGQPTEQPHTQEEMEAFWMKLSPNEQKLCATWLTQLQPLGVSKELLIQRMVSQYSAKQIGTKTREEVHKMANRKVDTLLKKLTQFGVVECNTSKEFAREYQGAMRTRIEEVDNRMRSNNINDLTDPDDLRLIDCFLTANEAFVSLAPDTLAYRMSNAFFDLVARNTPSSLPYSPYTPSPKE